MMKYQPGRLLAAALLLLAAGAPLRAQGVEEAATPTTPWSGWWWPSRTGNQVLGYRGEPGPLVKHDQVSGKRSTQWEQSKNYHFSPGVAAEWWGHCHAWAAASVLEKEPKHDVFYGGTPFRVGDLKQLFSEAHYSDRASFYGRRYNGQPGDDFQDMSPILVWFVLRQHIYLNKTPIVLDLSPGPQVWSYPVFKYRLVTQPLGGGQYMGQLSIWYADFNVHPDQVGTVTKQQDYSFNFQAQGNQLIRGSDFWTGASVQDHPDFAWYPTSRVSDNPEVDYNLLTQLNLMAQ
jgi:hypothetical protein